MHSDVLLSITQIASKSVIDDSSYTIASNIMFTPTTNKHTVRRRSSEWAANCLELASRLRNRHWLVVCCKAYSSMLRKHSLIDPAHDKILSKFYQMVSSCALFATMASCSSRSCRGNIVIQRLPVVASTSFTNCHTGHFDGSEVKIQLVFPILFSCLDLSNSFLDEHLPPFWSSYSIVKTQLPSLLWLCVYKFI